MRILIAPDKFKGSLGAREVAENIALGLRDGWPDAEIEIVPVADGGEGTAEVIMQGQGGEWVSCAAHDALGRAIAARYAWQHQSALAMIEMSEAAGLRRLQMHERDLLRANTFGVGEMMLDAIGRGARELIMGLGGSATSDGGFGMARAFGFRFLDDGKKEIEKVEDLIRLARIEKSDGAAQVPLQPRIIAAIDVRNPLLGERGAARVFGPQKGGTPEQIALLNVVLQKLADTITRDLGCDFRDAPGAGAAGGLGFGLMSFCGAELRSGFDVVSAAIELKEKIASTDVVITGEGRLDGQTLEGKAPAGVARLARDLGKPVYAIVGEVAEGAEVSALFDGVFPLARPPVTRTLAIELTERFLRERATELAGVLRSAHGA